MASNVIFRLFTKSEENSLLWLRFRPQNFDPYSRNGSQHEQLYRPRLTLLTPTQPLIPAVSAHPPLSPSLHSWFRLFSSATSPCHPEAVIPFHRAMGKLFLKRGGLVSLPKESIIHIRYSLSHQCLLWEDKICSPFSPAKIYNIPPKDFKRLQSDNR